MDGFTILEGLKNSQVAYIAVSKFIIVLVGVVGIIISGIGIMRFKQVADGKMSAGVPIFLTFLGAFMIASTRSIIPTLTETLLNTQTWDAGKSLLTEAGTGGMLPGVREALDTIIIFVKMLGLIAIFRSFLMFKSSADSKKDENYIPKALTHLVGGVFALNIEFTVSLLTNTFYPNLATFV